MMKLPVLSGRDVIKILKKIGFEEKRQKGSHIILAKETEQGKKVVVVPNHKEIDKGTLLEIIRQAGLQREEFLKLL
ncbi:type II toxin-antitoxin system HicA family toxin [Candidatus Woesearchaeota archaeon]|nr:type II toxin-antitoxin system HicA family toxin [Candidatus Woesearchaeota archaeon]